MVTVESRWEVCVLARKNFQLCGMFGRFYNKIFGKYRAKNNENQNAHEV